MTMMNEDGGRLLKMKSFVIADDLTGGCDVGLMFKAQGLSVCVLPTDEGLFCPGSRSAGLWERGQPASPSREALGLRMPT